MKTHWSASAVKQILIGQCVCLVIAFFSILGMICPVAQAQDCPQCVASSPPEPPLPTGLWLMTTHVNEVNVLFIAAHKGKSVSDLSRDDISVRDDNKPPAAMLGFRTEQELVLRVGVAIDTSSSLNSRFRFEQAAASAFFHQVLTQPGDLGFVMGFENYPTVTQDFVGDPNLLSQGVQRLKIGGGTALYDAVRTACQKMVHREEHDRVARVLVVLSDGQSNAGEVTLERAIDAAQEADVIIYTISTNYGSARPDDPTWDNVHAGDNNLRKLAEESGGRMLRPQSPSEVAKAFAKIGEELRSRYSVSYKPADFTPDGHYRRIKIEAHKLGEKFEVRARKGYYARSVSSLSADSSTVTGGTILASR
jgi:Ca-activated chloride channel homolog